MLLQPFDDGIEILRIAYKEHQREQAFELYKQIYPNLSEENFITFEEFYQMGIKDQEHARSMSRKTADQIFEEIRTLYYQNQWN